METFETGVDSVWNSKSFNRIGAHASSPGACKNTAATPDPKSFEVCKENLVSLQLALEPSD